MKKLIIIFFSLLILALCWYLFIKKYDYQISFESAYGPGTVYQEVYDLETINKEDSVKTVQLNGWKPFHEITQTVHLKEADSIELVWNFEAIHDSLTTITVSTRSTTNQFSQRLSIINPFKKSDYIKELKDNLIAFRNQLYDLQQTTYNIHLSDDVVTTPAATCACMTSTTSIKGKAQAMIATIGDIEQFLSNNNLKQVGYPMLQVRNWYIPENIITFDFCFPVVKNTNLKEQNGVFIRKIKPQKALYARFNGHYRLSNRAWFDLYEYAKFDNIDFIPQPLEVFRVNPRNGDSPVNWQADVYLPIKTD